MIHPAKLAWHQTHIKCRPVARGLQIRQWVKVLNLLFTVAVQGATVVAVTSGANINFDRLRLVSELADIGALREAMLATTIPEQPGSFLRFIQTALDPVPDVQVTEFKYRCAEQQAAAQGTDVGRLRSCGSQ